MHAVFAVLKPFVILAAVAFVTGFVGYLVLGAPGRALAQADVTPAAASGPASDDWNLPKHI